jgi:hypothetical protein
VLHAREGNTGVAPPASPAVAAAGHRIYSSGADPRPR